MLKIYKYIYINIIGIIHFQSERYKNKIPFKYVGLMTEYNGTDIVQTNQHIEMNYYNYIS